MADQLIRLDSYPFDSNTPTTYDELGYPVFDRGITSYILAACWKQFFSDGVFAAPATNLKITRGTGFNINIANGIGIIEGHMGGVFDKDGNGLDIKLTDAARGTMVYTIMLRYDNNNEYRSNWIRVIEGSAPATPEIAPAVKELRLGYVTIPSYAESIEDAEIVDERGTSVCPYAAPFEEIDIADVIEEAQRQAQIQLDYLANYIIENKQYIDAAISGSLAGEILSKINDVSSKLTDDEFKKYVFSDDVDETKSGTFATAGNIQAIFPIDGANIKEGTIGNTQIDISSLTDNETIVQNDSGQLAVKSGAFAPVSGGITRNNGVFYDDLQIEWVGHAYSERIYVSAGLIVSQYMPMAKVTDFHASGRGEGFYSGIYNLYSINLPNDTVIPSRQFDALSALHYISAPLAQSVTSYAFRNCSNLQYVDLPQASYIGTIAFQSCSSISYVSLPNLTELGDQAFQDCISLTEVELPKYTGEKLSAAGNMSSIFAGCTSISRVSLPLATTIPSAMFSGCTNLEEVYIPAANTVNGGAFNGCYVDPYKVTCPFLSTFVFENTINIGQGFAGAWSTTFSYIKSLSMSLVESVNTWGFSGFRFHELYLPNLTSLVTTKSGAGCMVNEMLYVPNLTEGWSGAVSQTNYFSMEGGTLVHGCPSITYSEFFGWNHASVYILSNCSTIYNSAFQGNSYITGIQVKTLGRIEQNCFSSCSNLEWVDILDADTSIDIIQTGAFNNCSKLTSVPFTSFVTSRIMTVAFYGCVALESVDFPLLSDFVSDQAFAYCTNLKTINMPKIASISTQAFNSCAQIAYAIIGASFIGASAFLSAGLSASCSIYLTYSGVASINVNYMPFQNRPNLSIYVPQAYYSRYLTTAGWSTLSNRIVSY